MPDPKQHYTDCVEQVLSLKRDKRYEEAEAVLLWAVNATEAESLEMKWGVAPWYYEQLAIIYRQQKRRTDEIAILQRYEAQQHAPGSKAFQLTERLAKLLAREH